MTNSNLSSEDLKAEAQYLEILSKTQHFLTNTQYEEFCHLAEHYDALYKLLNSYTLDPNLKHIAPLLERINSSFFGQLENFSSMTIE